MKNKQLKEHEREVAAKAIKKLKIKEIQNEQKSNTKKVKTKTKRTIWM